MCGIVGIIARETDTTKNIVGGIDRSSYRGYDSAGICIISKGGVHLKKDVGKLEDVVKGWDLENIKGSTGIGHCRWATHGSVTKENAHPHADCSGNLFIVHNGIIENYQELKTKLEESGHKFKSDTDSEVIAHYFEEHGLSKESVKSFISEAVGTFAVVALEKDSKRLFAIKRDSPLCIVPLEDGFAVASDIYAFSDSANKAAFLEDDEFVVVDKDGFQIFDKAGSKIERDFHEFDWQESSDIGKYDHYMLKEIKEEPAAAKRLVQSMNTAQRKRMEKFKQMISEAEKVIFTACGTSYFASLLGVYFLQKAEIETQTLIASEFEDYASVDKNTLVVAISQSGETMDVIKSLKHAKSKGAGIASIVNVPHSTIQRMSDLSLSIEAGQEVCVASTKTYVNQVLVLLRLAEMFGYKTDLNSIISEMEKIFETEGEIKELAASLKDRRDIYIIGRGISYPVTREIALKLKEISYIHAEGMMGGELKHGTLALIEEGTPVIVLANGNEHIISNGKEAEARGARVIAITNREVPFKEKLRINAKGDASFALCSVVIGQLLTYYVAKHLDLPIDKPRSLAKSCTVL